MTGLGSLLRNFIKQRIFSASVPTIRRQMPPSKQLILEKDVAGLDVLFFANKHNSLSQRLALELKQRNHNVKVHEVDESHSMVHMASTSKPDLIVCPFLTKRVPEEVHSNPDIPCLIVHPGIEGDRGMSSLDWALKEKQSEWGVTVMQAEEDMDTGDIWSTIPFPVERRDINTLTKSSLYMNEVTRAATLGVLEALDNLHKSRPPRPLDYSNPRVQGALKPNMKKRERIVDWDQTADEVACQVRMSDSSPGAVARFCSTSAREDCKWTEEFRVFGAHLERGQLANVKGRPGQLIGHRDDAVLVKCGQGAVWLSHLKLKKLKLPSTYWLNSIVPELALLPSPPVQIQHGSFPDTFQEIWTTLSPEGVCYVHFNFYNGAMNTSQCRRLESVLERVEQDERCTVIVLMGGYNFFSNGIHLNTIESAADPETESWHNINAINDVVRSIFKSQKLTVAALRGNAGAGGAMMALASDLVVSRSGVVLNPHYKSMHLYGSEYHTYFLKERVGQHKAQELLNSAEPVLSTQAVNIGLLDAEMGQSVEEFEDDVLELAKHLASPSVQSTVFKSKRKLPAEGLLKTLEEHRAHELVMMRNNFQDPAYHKARKEFVFH